MEDTDLVSLVLSLRPRAAADGPAYWGRAVHAQSMRLIDACNPGLAKWLHDLDARKPLTCSNLMGTAVNHDRRCVVRPDQVYWVRVTAFTPALAAILFQIEQERPTEVELDGIRFNVEAATTDPAVHPWAGRASYQGLHEYYRGKAEALASSVNLNFTSLTSFHSGGKTLPFPLPELVFGSLADSWDAYSGRQLPTDVRAAAPQHVAVSRYTLATRAVQAKSMHWEIGCTGDATYRVLAQEAELAWPIHLLAHFAFYAGVGYQTTIGFGQVRAADR